jgi:hypothetical protein
MVVYPGSFSYDIWNELPIPMTMRVYFFNITNPQEIIDRVPGAKPIFKELGEHYLCN